MTNGEKIRGMTDEELAEYLTTFQNTFGEEYEGMMSCFDWLKQPVEERNAKICKRRFKRRKDNVLVVG